MNANIPGGGAPGESGPRFGQPPLNRPDSRPSGQNGGSPNSDRQATSAPGEQPRQSNPDTARSEAAPDVTAQAAAQRAAEQAATERQEALSDAQEGNPPRDPNDRLEALAEVVSVPPREGSGSEQASGSQNPTATGEQSLDSPKDADTLQPPLSQTQSPSMDNSSMGVPPVPGAGAQAPSPESIVPPSDASTSGTPKENGPTANPTVTPAAAEQPGGSATANQAGSAEQGTGARTGAQPGSAQTPREGAGTPQGAAAQAAPEQGASTQGQRTEQPPAAGQAPDQGSTTSAGSGTSRPETSTATSTATQEAQPTPPAAQPDSGEQPPAQPTEQQPPATGQEAPRAAEADQPPSTPKGPDGKEKAPDGGSPTTPPPAEAAGEDGKQDHKSIDEMRRDYFHDNLGKDPKNKEKYDKLKESAFGKNSEDRGERKLGEAFEDYKRKRAKAYAESETKDTATEDEKLLDFLRIRAQDAKNHEEGVKRSNSEVLLHNFMEEKANKARLDTYFDESLTSDEKAQALKEVEDNFKPGMNRLKKLWHKVNRGLDEMKPSVVKEHFGLVRKHFTLWRATKDPEHLKLAWEHARKGGLRMIGTIGIGLFLLSLACWAATPLLIAQTPRFIGKGGS